MKKTQTVFALSALALTVGFQTARADFIVNVGYADSLRPNSFFPDPWQGSPNTIFFGRVANTGEFDAGAIQVVNTGTTPLTLSAALVDGFDNGASYHIWDGQIGAAGAVIPVGESLIMTQNDGTENFDTSDDGPSSPSYFDSAGNPHGDATTPHVHLTLDGLSYNLVDTGQVLNSSGFDYANYNNSNESFAWRPIGTFGGQSGVPEPGAFTCLAACGMAGMFLLRRRHRRA